MMAWLQSELTQEMWTRALAVLFDCGVKSLVLLALAALAAAGLRRASAATRHLVWALALGGLLLLPALSIVLPKWQLPILPQAVHFITPKPYGVPTGPAPGKTASVVTTPAARVEDPAPMPRVAYPVTEPSVTPPVSIVPAPRLTSPFWLMAAWLGGVVVILAPLAVGLGVVARLVRKARPFPGEDWPELMRALMAPLGLRRRVRVLCAGRAAMPMATGLWRPTILLPGEAEAWTAEKRRAVLLHELAHVKRRDCLTHALARVAVALYWFNPLAWVALRRLRIERERACDDLVLTTGERASVYASHLLDIARTMQTGALLSAAAITMARKGQLEGRLLAILDATRKRRAVTRWSIFCGIFLLAVLVMPLATMHLGAQPPFLTLKLTAHKLYQAGRDPGVFLEMLPAPWRLEHTHEGMIPMPMLRVNGKEFQGGLGFHPGAGFWLQLIENAGEQNSAGDRLAFPPGKYRVSYVYHAFRLLPTNGAGGSLIPGGKPVEVKELESNEVEFEVVEQLPEGYFKAEFQPGWDEILRQKMKTWFTDDWQKSGVAGALLLIHFESLPFNLAFKVYAQKEGSADRIPVTDLVMQKDTTGLTCGAQPKEMTWDNVRQTRWRLILEPAEEVASKHPPIRSYYGRTFMTEWLSFEPSARFDDNRLEDRMRQIGVNGGVRTKINYVLPIDLDRKRSWANLSGAVWPLPPDFELGWDPNQGGGLRINPQSAVHLLPLPGARDSVEAATQLGQQTAQLNESKADRLTGETGKESFGGVLSSERQVFLVRMVKGDDSFSTVTWWRMPPVTKALPTTTTLPLRFLPNESKVSTDSLAPDAVYRWRIDTTATLQVTDRGIHLRGYGVMAGNWGSGVNRAGDEGPIDLIVRPRLEGDQLVLVTERQNKSGRVSSEKKIPVPVGCTLETRWRQEPFVMDGKHYISLWEGRFVRAGQTVEIVIFAAAAAPMDAKLPDESELEVNYPDGSKGLNVIPFINKSQTVGRLRELVPSDMAAEPQLVAQLLAIVNQPLKTEGDTTRYGLYDAVVGLGKLGPAAREALPALEKLTRDSEWVHRKAAMDAIRRIQAGQ